MAKKVLAIVGSYRKGGTVDSTVDHILAAAKDNGAETEKIDLLDQHIEFCANCRSCTQTAGPSRGQCVQKDDMTEILDKVEKADALVLAAPVNFFNVTAVFRRFMERLVVYAYWPWDKRGAPANRIKELKRKAVFVTAAAMPTPLIPLATGAPRALKATAKTVGFKPAGSLWIGFAGMKQKTELSDKTIKKARELGNRLVG